MFPPLFVLYSLDRFYFLVSLVQCKSIDTKARWMFDLKTGVSKKKPLGIYVLLRGKLGVTWRRKFALQVLENVKWKTAYNSDCWHFPQEGHSCDKGNICRNREQKFIMGADNMETGAFVLQSQSILLKVCLCKLEQIKNREIKQKKQHREKANLNISFLPIIFFKWKLQSPFMLFAQFCSTRWFQRNRDLSLAPRVSHVKG